MPDHLLPRLLHQMLFDVRMFVRHIQRPLVAILSIRGQRRIQGNLHPLVPSVPQRIQRQVRSNPEQPRREFRGGHIVTPRAIHPNKNFLRKVFRLFPITHHPVQEIDQGTAIAMQQKRERLFVARLHVQHELYVRPGHGRHTLSNTCSLRKLQVGGNSEVVVVAGGLWPPPHTPSPTPSEHLTESTNTKKTAQNNKRATPTKTTHTTTPYRHPHHSS